MEARRIRTETIPEAERAKRLVREGFGRGGFSFIEVNEAERALADARARRIEVLKAYHLNLAQLDRLTSRHIAFARIEEPVR